MRELYPEIEPYNTFFLEPDSLHSIYVEECGNKNGLPVIFLHGGPGQGCGENHRRYFDPAVYRIIIFDQRGTNRSTPRACVDENTSQHLIQDMDAIRRQLKIDSWCLFGGSWGATLALLYAQAFPQHVMGLIVRGTFLARKQDLAWFIDQGANKLFPDYWQEFINIIPKEERHDLVSAYYKRVHGSDEAKRDEAIKSWAIWGGRLVTYLFTGINHDAFQPEDMQAAHQEVAIETHYAQHQYFIEENQILENADVLHDIPVHIIHGRRDLTCTLDASWDLHRALPNSTLTIVREGGHLAGTPNMINALVSATDDMAVTFK